ncbi:hypothetical protein NQ318_007685 [Aromia moschata]|uniref:Late embryogenesis abundant protein n=1 Tax=Aromia moschata TaxID=1265417 RepID=A0AAV8XJT0_9CUCU|nr:hypothetical protein NQ318_007685 [Aromia moschata]
MEETTDVKRQNIANGVVGGLDEAKAMEGHLISSRALESTNAKTINETDTTDSTPTETEEILQNFPDYATVDDALITSNTRTIDDMIADATTDPVGSAREKKVTLKKGTIIPQHLQFLLACKT